MSLLELRDVSTEYETDDGPLRAVESVDMELEAGEILGIVGESGCGKTTLMKTILNLLPGNGRVVGGEIEFDGRDLTQLSKSEWQSVRWAEISYIIQNAMNALDPVYTVGAQFVEIIRAHTDDSKAEARTRAGDMLEKVGIGRGRLNDYPHELSGGQRQRVVVALALALEPPLIVADEPTTGLDVVTQEEILTLIQDMQSELGSAMIIITHDISVVAEVADRTGVMYGGQLVEVGDTVDVFNNSAHPYTMGLTNAFPSLADNPERLVSIPGTPPDLVTPPEGCRFAERCPFETEACAREPPVEGVGDRHTARCHYTDQAARFREESSREDTWTEGADR